ncbi:MAG: hypothetical protein FJ319_02110 [SAR202 cluster bacterium]|nr:hypothetical protein [SAR202 cluster bacterium]
MKESQRNINEDAVRAALSERLDPMTIEADRWKAISRRAARPTRTFTVPGYVRVVTAATAVAVIAIASAAYMAHISPGSTASPLSPRDAFAAAYQKMSQVETIHYAMESVRHSPITPGFVTTSTYAYQDDLLRGIGFLEITSTQSRNGQVTTRVELQTLRTSSVLFRREPLDRSVLPSVLGPWTRSSAPNGVIASGDFKSTAVFMSDLERLTEEFDEISRIETTTLSNEKVDVYHAVRREWSGERTPSPIGSALKDTWTIKLQKTTLAVWIGMDDGLLRRMEVTMEATADLPVFSNDEAQKDWCKPFGEGYGEVTSYGRPDREDLLQDQTWDWLPPKQIDCVNTSTGERVNVWRLPQQPDGPFRSTMTSTTIVTAVNRPLSLPADIPEEIQQLLSVPATSK